MKTFKTLLAVSFALVCSFQYGAAQDKPKQPVIVAASIADFALNDVGPLAPTVPGSYRIIPGLLVEDPKDGSSSWSFGIQPFPDTGLINDAIMDNEATVVGFDLANELDLPTSSEIVAYECIESLGVDPDTSRFLLQLTLTVETTATELQWDTFEFDLLDPGDIDGDGYTEEPDGQLDTGDGIADQPFPLDPVGLSFGICMDDGDCGPGGDTIFYIVSQGLFIGANAGGSPISFDPEAGQIDVTSAFWELRNFDGEFADLNLDGTPDGPFEVTDFAVFNQPKGWQGSFGVGFANDDNPDTTQDWVSGTVKTNRLVVTYLSDIERVFRFGTILLGDVNLDGVVNLLDIQPFVNLVATQTFQAEADLNGDGDVSLLDIAPFVVELTN